MVDYAKTRFGKFERPKSLTQTVLAHLRSLIVNGDLELGEQLSERRLADQLRVSKTPVREALAQLQNEGLVRVYPQRGAFVFTLSAREVAELCEFRSAVESAALKLALSRNSEALAGALALIVDDMAAAQRLGDQRAYLALDTYFHALFFEHCGNSILRDSYERAIGKIAALRTHLATKPLHTKLSFLEHREMSEAVARRDLAQTLAILDVHLGRTRQTYSAEVEDIAAADRKVTEAS